MQATQSTQDTQFTNLLDGAPKAIYQSMSLRGEYKSAGTPANSNEKGIAGFKNIGKDALSGAIHGLFFAASAEATCTIIKGAVTAVKLYVPKIDLGILGALGVSAGFFVGLAGAVASLGSAILVAKVKTRLTAEELAAIPIEMESQVNALKLVPVGLGIGIGLGLTIETMIGLTAGIATWSSETAEVTGLVRLQPAILAGGGLAAVIVAGGCGLESLLEAASKVVPVKSSIEVERMTKIALMGLAASGLASSGLGATSIITGAVGLPLRLLRVVVGMTAGAASLSSERLGVRAVGVKWGYCLPSSERGRTRAAILGVTIAAITAGVLGEIGSPISLAGAAGSVAAVVTHGFLSRRFTCY